MGREIREEGGKRGKADREERGEFLGRGRGGEGREREDG